MILTIQLPYKSCKTCVTNHIEFNHIGSIYTYNYMHVCAHDQELLSRLCKPCDVKCIGTDSHSAIYTIWQYAVH